MIKIICTNIIHNKKECIQLKFDYNKNINNIIRSFSYVKFSASFKAWYLPKNKTYLQNIIEALKDIAIVDVSKLKTLTQHQLPEIKINHYNTISEYNKQQLTIYIKTLILKGYSKSTINTYKNEFTIFLQTLIDILAATYSSILTMQTLL